MMVLRVWWVFLWCISPFAPTVISVIMCLLIEDVCTIVAPPKVFWLIVSLATRGPQNLGTTREKCLSEQNYEKFLYKGKMLQRTYLLIALYVICHSSTVLIMSYVKSQYCCCCAFWKTAHECMNEWMYCRRYHNGEVIMVFLLCRFAVYRQSDGGARWRGCLTVETWG